jgi:nicotinamidase-related amidase
MMYIFAAEGYEIYAVEDCSGGTSDVAHRAALTRMQQVGVAPVTWVQVLLEWQRDWANKAVYSQVMKIILDVTNHITTHTCIH